MWILRFSVVFIKFVKKVFFFFYKVLIIIWFWLYGGWGFYCFRWFVFSIFNIYKIKKNIIVIYCNINNNINIGNYKIFCLLFKLILCDFIVWIGIFWDLFEDWEFVDIWWVLFRMRMFDICWCWFRFRLNWYRSMLLFWKWWLFVIIDDRKWCY